MGIEMRGGEREGFGGEREGVIERDSEDQSSGHSFVVESWNYKM